MESCSWGHLWEQLALAAQTSGWLVAQASGIDRKSACILFEQTNMHCNIASIENTWLAYPRVLCPRGLGQSTRWQVALEAQEGTEALVVMVDCLCTYYN